MRSGILTILALFCLTFLFFSCKKDEDPVEESPFFEFFKEPSVIIDTTNQAADTWEYGFAFTPLTDGKITKLGIKLPATGNYTVTLWDISGNSPVVLRAATVNTGSPDAEVFSSIPEVSVQKNAALGITILSDAFYRITRPGNGTFPFPKTVGNIRIDSFHENINNSGSPDFPALTNDTRVAPCVNVIFIAD